MIQAVRKYATVIILLAFVIMTSVLRFHHHDCHGHTSFAFSDTIECPSPHVHLYDVGDNDSPIGDHYHFCHIINEFQAFEHDDFSHSLPVFVAAIPFWDCTTSLFLECATKLCCNSTPKLPLDRFEIQICLRAPPILL